MHSKKNHRYTVRKTARRSDIHSATRSLVIYAVYNTGFLIRDISKPDCLFRVQNMMQSIARDEIGMREPKSNTLSSVTYAISLPIIEAKDAASKEQFDRDIQRISYLYRGL